MHDPAAFGRWLKQRRISLDLTQEQLARRVACAPETVRKLEAGGRRASRAIALRLADALSLAGAERAAFVHLARAHPMEASFGRVAPQRWAVPAEPGEPVPLLATKLYRPRHRARVVARPHLLARLETGMDGILTLIAAPAGFGKTTLLAEWLSQLAAGGHAVAWLALDAGDNDPLQFLRYLIAALQTIAPAAGATVVPLLSSPQPPPLATVLPVLINDLAEVQPGSILVLDDYHVIETPAVHQALQFLLNHLPPQLHVVVASRADPSLPLARWRVRRQLTELRAHDLRFTLEEARAFFDEVMGVALTAADVAALEARTEGWVAGLQLAALSLQDRPAAQLSAFIDAFTGSNRFVVDYLAEEVFERQPAHLQTFLLQTSILDQLSGPLCDALLLGSEPADGARAYSQVLLEELERSNLFVVALDDQRRWYRYHHLFAEVLQERLRSGAREDTMTRLHGRASAWFEQQGMVVEAVQHALNAHDWEGAARLIQAHGQLLLARGQTQVVLGWLNALPETAARAHPFLDVIHAGALFNVNQLEEAERRLQLVGQSSLVGTHHDSSGDVPGTTTLIRAYIALFRGDLASWLTLSRQALEMLPGTADLGRTAARLDLASAFLISGEVTLANERSLVVAVAAVGEVGNLSTLFRGIVTQAALQRCQGRLRQSAATYAEAAHVLADPIMLETIPSGANYYFGLGDVLRERNDLNGAEELLTLGRAVVRRMQLAEAASITDGYIALAQLQQARGAHDEAIATLHELEEVAHQRSFVPDLLTRAGAARAQVALRHGDLDFAVQWAATSSLQPAGDLSYLSEPLYLTLARVRIAQAQSDLGGPNLHEVLEQLDHLLGTAQAVGRIHSVIAILVLRALALQAQADRRGALAALERALMLAAPEGYVRIFVDEGAPMAMLLGQGFELREWGIGAEPRDHDVRAYAQQILALFAAEGISLRDRDVPAVESRTRVPEGEVLTERELDVLRLLASGRSNMAIAAELIVAVGTVKRHVNSIMSKLDASNRLAAVARARELGLL